MSKRLFVFVVLLFFVVLLSACALAERERSSVNARAIVEEGGLPTEIAPTPVKIDKSQFKLAKEIASPTWINSENLIWNDLRGKVVVVDFSTFACYNCKNTLPYKKEWDQKYRAQGLVVLGVHTPELSFEKDVENVRKAVKEYNIRLIPKLCAKN